MFKKEGGKQVEVCQVCADVIDKAARKAYDHDRYLKSKKGKPAARPAAHKPVKAAAEKPAKTNYWKTGADYSKLHYKQQKAYIRQCKDSKELEKILGMETGNSLNGRPNKIKVRLINKCINRVKAAQ